MLAKKCDRCETYYTVDEDTNFEFDFNESASINLANGFMFSFNNKYGKTTHLYFVDLCPKCAEELKKWYKGVVYR